MACDGLPVAIHHALGTKESVIAVALGEGALELRSTQNGALLRRIKAHTDGLLASVLSPNQRIIATGGMDGFVRLYSTSGELLDETRLRGWVDQLAFTTNDILVAGGGRTLAVVAHGHCETLALPSSILALDAGVNCEGESIALAAHGNTVTLITVSPLARIHEHLLSTQIRRIAICPNGDMAGLAGQDSNLRVLKLGDSRAGPLSGYVRPPKSLSFSRDGVLLATSGLDLGVIWILPDGTAQQAEPILVAHDGTPTIHMRFHPELPRLLMTTQAGSVFMLDAVAEVGLLHTAPVKGVPSAVTWCDQRVVVGTTMGQLIGLEAVG